MNNFSIEDFRKETLLQLDTFISYYLQKHKENPDCYPIELPHDNSGLFFEQFCIFNEDFS